MDELNTWTFCICTALLAVEVLSGLFPQKSGELIRGLAVLAVLAVLLAGIMKLDFEWERQPASPIAEKTETLDELAAQNGIALLRERLYALLETAGIETLDGEQGIEVRYRQDDSGEITIDRVHVRIRYGADMDRTFALLRSVLTEAIPVEIETE